MAELPGLSGLLQLADSAFPAGGFAHSDGIEALTALGVLRDEATLTAVLVSHRRLTLGSCDAWFVEEAHAAAGRRNAEELRSVAAADLAARPSAGAREASLTLGRALLRAGREILGEPAAWAGEALDDMTPRPTAFGAVARAAGASAADAGEAYAFTVLSGMAAAAVRLQVVAPLAAQRALRRALESGSPAESDGDWAAFSPLLDVAAMRHEHLTSRLFAS